MLPKFSLRVILLVTTVAAGLSAVVARAVAGESWAISVSAAVGWAVVALVFHAVFYVLATALGGLRREAVDGAEPSQAEREAVVE